MIRALAVNRHAGVRDRGLAIKSVSNRLDIAWHARPIHPWDRGVSPERAARLFVQQCLADVDAAIVQLFAAFPEIDEIELRVLDADSDARILAGRVARAQATVAEATSVGMKLKSIGLNYQLMNWRFEPLEGAAMD